MRIVTEITNTPGLKYTFIGKDSTGVSFYNEEVNIEYLEKRKKMQDVIDGKDKKNINKYIDYQVPKIIEENTFYKTGDKFNINVDQKNRTINLINESTGEQKTFKTKYFPSKVRVDKDVLFYDDYRDEVTPYDTISINLNTEAVIGTRTSELVTSGDTGLGVPSLDIRMGIVQPEPLIISQDLASKTFIFNVRGSELQSQFTFFPVLTSTVSLNDLKILRNNFLGLTDKYPALIKYDNSIFLRTVNRSKIDNLKDSFIGSTVPTIEDTSVNISQNYDPSNSSWAHTFSEGYVMDTRISSTSLNDTSNNWELRIGKGAQIYSFIKEGVGELIAPQFTRGESIWNDEVFQSATVDITRDPNRHYHSSGIYIYSGFMDNIRDKDPSIRHPWYTPRLATQIDEGNRSYYSMNWMQPTADTSTWRITGDDAYKCYMLNLTKYKDLGDGVIEVTIGHYNFGPDTYGWNPMPFGATRTTSLPYPFWANTDQSTYTPVTAYFGDDPNVVKETQTTGGWTVFCSDSAGNDSSMGYVFGLDDDLPGGVPYSFPSLVRSGYLQYKPDEIPEGLSDNEWRNAIVINTIRRYDITTRNGIWSRVYFVFGNNRDNVRQKILNRDLTNETSLQIMNNPESESSLIGYKLSLTNSNFNIEKSNDPDFYLYEQLINKGMPLFEVVMNDGTKFVTWDPYTSGTTKMYSGAVQVINLLGFCLTTDDATGPYTYDTLDSIFSDYSSYYDGNGQSLSTRLPLN